VLFACPVSRCFTAGHQKVIEREGKGLAGNRKKICRGDFPSVAYPLVLIQGIRKGKKAFEKQIVHFTPDGGNDK
jgi:hypothetical protein